MHTHTDLFLEITNIENLYHSWLEFKNGKRKKRDVQLFERNLEDNLFELRNDFEKKTYQHSNYTSFYITDPKLRHIHKAVVRDRIVHHAIYRVLYPMFDKSFIYDSYSCRDDKGTHRAVNRLTVFSKKASRNYTDTCFVLKCDVRKFFDSVDHEILKGLIRARIKDADTLALMDGIIGSFGKDLGYINNNQILLDFASPKGMPIGNLTSQLFANVYLNELDQFVKHILRVRFYIRYCDDFVILDPDKRKLDEYRQKVGDFLKSKLKIALHKDKVSIGRLSQGIDFLGYIVKPHYRILRTKTKNRMLRRVNKKNGPSYLGLLKHCNGHELEKAVRESIENQTEE